MRRQKLNLTLINVGLLLIVVSPLTPLYLPLMGVGIGMTICASLQLRRCRRQQTEAHHGN